uniref:Uncharacterized protein n=1 Tax=Romanomermis culicivorax TaxID=13658 RepID=A0A915L9B5_ROMCU
MPKFKTRAKSYKVSFKNMDTCPNVHATLATIFDQVLVYYIRPSVDQLADLVGFYLHQKSSMDHPLVLPYCNAGELTPDNIYSQIEQVEQSNSDMTFNGDMLVKFTHVISQKGGVYYKKNVETFKEKLKRNRCIVKIKNSDNLCYARALAVARAYVDNDPHLNTICKPRNTANTMQKRLAAELMRMAGLGDLPIGYPIQHQLEED